MFVNLKTEPSPSNFQPGFNLLVGENGAGKTTLLRALLAVLGRSRALPHPALADEDIGLGASELHVRAQIDYLDGGLFESSTYGRRLGGPAKRSRSHHASRVLWYGSNEATCSSFVSRRVRRYSSDSHTDTVAGEQWLFDQSNQPSIQGSEQPHFGRSEDIKEFVFQILSMFSKGFCDFQWSFEPYSCSIHPPSISTKNGDVPPHLRRKLEMAIMRHLQETDNPLRWLDKASVLIDAGGFLDHERERKPVISSFIELLGHFEPDAKSVQFFEHCTAEVRLTPRIRIKVGSGGTLLLSQLSDGEQRLFSLFVDIARQLRLPPSDVFAGDMTAAVVLIDEIDVHLHPKWQRMIVPALEDLFPACQFIATTHSPFVVQGVSESRVQHLNSPILGSFTDRGIEEIAVKVMGIETPQVSRRYLEMLDSAKKYFAVLEEAQTVHSRGRDNLRELTEELDRLSQRYAWNPAYQAYLELHGALTLGPAESR